MSCVNVHDLKRTDTSSGHFGDTKWVSLFDQNNFEVAVFIRNREQALKCRDAFQTVLDMFPVPEDPAIELARQGLAAQGRVQEIDVPGDAHIEPVDGGCWVSARVFVADAPIEDQPF